MNKNSTSESVDPTINEIFDDDRDQLAVDDDVFIKVCDYYEARLGAEKRRGEEARYLPREK